MTARYRIKTSHGDDIVAPNMTEVYRFIQTMGATADTLPSITQIRLDLREHLKHTFVSELCIGGYISGDISHVALDME